MKILAKSDMSDEKQAVLSHFAAVLKDMGFNIFTSYTGRIKMGIDDSFNGSIFVTNAGTLLISTKGYLREVSLSDPDSFDAIKEIFEEVKEIMIRNKLQFIDPYWVKR
jgi:hypothetical protein